MTYETPSTRKAVDTRDFTYNSDIDLNSIGDLVRLNNWMQDNALEKCMHSFDGVVDQFETDSLTFTVDNPYDSPDLDVFSFAINPDRYEIDGHLGSGLKKYVAGFVVPIGVGSAEIEVVFTTYPALGIEGTGTVWSTVTASAVGPAKIRVYDLIDSEDPGLIVATVRIRSTDESIVTIVGAFGLYLASYTHGGGILSLMSGAYMPICAEVGAAVDEWRSTGLNSLTQSVLIRQPQRTSNFSDRIGAVGFNGGAWLESELAVPPEITSFAFGVLVQVNNAGSSASGTVLDVGDGVGSSVVRVEFSSGNLRAIVVDDASNTITASGSYPSDDAWHDVNVFYDGDVLEVWVDGTRIANASGFGNDVDYTGPGNADLFLGARLSGTNAVTCDLAMPELSAPLVVEPIVTVLSRASVAGLDIYPLNS